MQLRDLSLPPGAALDVAVTVDVGCGAGAYAWSVRAKQANRFNGSPGNDFELVSAPEDLVTTVTGACALRFAAQPQDARVDERLSAADFDPAGPPISVELVDGAGDRVTSASPTISLTLASLTGFGTLSGTSTVTGAAGLATFGDLSVDAPGTYRLQATAAPGRSPPRRRCSPSSRWRSSASRTSTAPARSTPRGRGSTRARSRGLGADAGFLQLSFNTGFRPDCAGYDETSADWALVLGPTGRSGSSTRSTSAS